METSSLEEVLDKLFEKLDSCVYNGLTLPKKSYIERKMRQKKVQDRLHVILPEHLAKPNVCTVCMDKIESVDLECGHKFCNTCLHLLMDHP